MQRFKKAIALLILIFFIVYSAIAIFIKKDDLLAREKRFDGGVVTFVMVDKYPLWENKYPILAGREVVFGYYFEYLNGTEMSDVYYKLGNAIEIKKDENTTSKPSDFAKYFKKSRDINKEINYVFNESGQYKIISQFEHKNNTITTEFLVEVKTKDKYDEERLKGSLVTVGSFILVAIFAIYLYEKLEKPKSKN